MKKEILLIVNGIIRSSLAGTMVVCALVMSSFTMSANAQKYSLDKSTPEIKYLGSFQNKLLFQIDLQNESENPLFVTIKDDEGTVLFMERVRDNKFSRKFAFEKEEFEGKKLSFIVHDSSENNTQTFQVARNMRFVEDVVITRL